jgi:hypothetical protein
MLQCPFNKAQFLQNTLDVFNNIPIPAKQMQYSKRKCNIAFLLNVISLWSNAPYFCRNNIPTECEACLDPRYTTHAVARCAGSKARRVIWVCGTCQRQRTRAGPGWSRWCVQNSAKFMVIDMGYS